MKRTLIASVVLSLVAAIAPAGADLTSVSTASGVIAVPAGAARAQRCVHGDAPNGSFGWVLTATPGKIFTLTTPMPSLDDVNIGFYKTITSCETAANIAGTYSNSLGNESGIVPALATKAIIYTGSVPAPPEHAGSARANTPFTYTETTAT